MANAPAQSVHEQISQTQQDALAHAAAQPPVHPMAAGGS